MTRSRRAFLRRLGLSAAALPFAHALPSAGGENHSRRKKRLVFVFTPNGVVPRNFWPSAEGAAFALTPILEPLAAFKDRMLVLKGIGDKVRGDGDGHMRGIGCLLTGIELFPGNIQGGSDTPAGWASGISLDQEIKNRNQRDPATRTRFGSLEFGCLVPERADTWTRMVYAGPNQPVAPIDDPYRMFQKLYGSKADRAAVASVLDEIQLDLKKLRAAVAKEDRATLDRHAELVRDLEKDIAAAAAQPALAHPEPKLEPGIRRDNDNMPKLSRLQIELMVSAFAADFNRVATLQYTNSVGGAKMRWLGVEQGHHELSHAPDSDAAAMDKLTKINRWFAGELAHLCKRLAETPEPGGPGSLLDNTVILWGNELGAGNSHTPENLPFIALGGGADWKTGRSLRFKDVAHHRLLLALAAGLGHEMKTFGNPAYCKDGPLTGLS